MERIRTAWVKRIIHESIDFHVTKFSGNFIKNKEVMNQLASVPSKKLKSVITSYTVKLVKESKLKE